MIAAQSAQKLGIINHNVVHINEKSDLNQMVELLLHFDQPFGDLSFLPTFAISNEVKKSIKVVLSGDGGDELAGGYPKFRYFNILQLYSKTLPLILRRAIYQIINTLPNLSRLKKITLLSTQTPEEQIFGLSTYIDESKARSFFIDSTCLPTPVRHFIINDKLDNVQNITINQCKTSLQSKMLVKVDRMSMLAGIEVRVPLLDTRFASELFYLHPDQKIKGTTNKIVLRNLLSSLLPSYSNTKKTGFDFDYKDLATLGWITRIITELRESSTEGNKMYQYLDYQSINHWIKQYETGEIKYMSKQSQFQLLFNIYTLYIWFKYNLRH